MSIPRSISIRVNMPNLIPIGPAVWLSIDGQRTHTLNLYYIFFRILTPYFCILQLFSVIVFGCIASRGYGETQCLYGDANACRFGIAIGVLAFLGLMGFLLLDALFDNISSVQQRKYVVIADMAFSGISIQFNCFIPDSTVSLCKQVVRNNLRYM